MRRDFFVRWLIVLCLTMAGALATAQDQGPGQELWKATNLTGVTVQALATDGHMLYAAVDLDESDQVYRTSDSGTSWTLIVAGLPTENLTIYDLELTDDSTLLLATDAGVFRSTDQGNTWTTSSLNADEITALGVAGDVVFAAGIGAIYRSEDSGQTWTAGNTGLPANAFFFGVSASADASTVFAVGGMIPGGGRVWKSTDGGQSWSEVFTRSTFELFYAVAVDPDTDNVFVGTQEMSGGRLYRSEDGGQTWTRVLSAQSIYEVAASPYNNEIIVAAGSPGSRGGVLRSRDQGETWFPSNDGLSGTSVYRLAIPSDANLYIGTFDHGVYRSLFIVPVGMAEFAIE